MLQICWKDLQIFCMSSDTIQMLKFIKLFSVLMNEFKYLYVFLSTWMKFMSISIILILAEKFFFLQKPVANNS